MSNSLTDEEIRAVAIDDPDAPPMSEGMLARANAERRLEKSRPKRIAAARTLVQEAGRGSKNPLSIAAPSPVTPKPKQLRGLHIRLNVARDNKAVTDAPVVDVKNNNVRTHWEREELSICPFVR